VWVPPTPWWVTFLLKAWGCSPLPAQPFDLARTSSCPPLPSPCAGNSERRRRRRTALAGRNLRPVLRKQASGREPAGAQGDILLHRAASRWSRLFEAGAEGVAVSQLHGELQRAACQSCVFGETTGLLSPPFLPRWAVLGRREAGSGRGCHPDFPCTPSASVSGG